MTYEVEQKYRTSDHATIKARIVSLGGDVAELVEQEDCYLSHPSRDFARTGEALRLRRVGDWNAVTYKGPRQPGPTKTREEIEVPFAAGSQPLNSIRKVFENLGFRPVATIKKSRTPCHLSLDGRTIEVVLDEVEGEGLFVEVEVVATEEDVSAAQDAVMRLAETLGLTDLEPRSYLRMALDRGAGV